MGFFTKAYKAPQGNPANWSALEVKHWIKSQKLTKLWDDQKLVLKPLDGKLLLESDLPAKLCSHDQLPALEAALQELRMTWPQHQAASSIEPVAASMSAVSSPTPGSASSRVVEQPAGETRELVFSPVSSCVESAAETDDDQAPDNARPAQAGSAAAVRGYAELLMRFTRETNPDAITLYLSGPDGKVGAGLAQLAVVNSAVGRVFGTVHELSEVAGRTAVNRENCSKLEQLGFDVLRTLDQAGRRQHGPSSQLAVFLADKFEAAIALVEAFAEPGWLLHAACNERLKEQFDALHDSIVDALRGELLDGGVPGSRNLARSDYRDITKALRRLLKQQGSGSLTAGLRALMLDCQNPNAAFVRELAAMLDVPPGVLLQEAAALPLPMSERDADEMYRGLQDASASVTSAMHRGIFDWYDRERSGALDAKALTCLLSDVGLLDRLKPQEAEHLAANTLRTADVDGDGLLSFEEFCVCYSELPLSKARGQLRTRLGMLVEDDLRGIFVAFASFGTGSRQAAADLDGARFAKLLKDCGLLDRRCSTTECDIIFAKVKSKGQRRITFDQFVSAVGLCSAKRGITLEAAVRQILAAGRPIANGTRADAVRLHDDRSTYTGVHSRGGPNTVEPSKDLSVLLDRSEADVRGVKKALPHRPSAGDKRSSLGGSSVVFEDPARRVSQTTPPLAQAYKRHTGSSAGTSDGATLASQFANFAAFGSGGGGDVEGEAKRMDGTLFIKLCRECGLLDRAFTTTAADLVFARARTKGSNKMTFADFQRALSMVADEKGMPLADVHASILTSRGPMLTPSRA